MANELAPSMCLLAVGVVLAIGMVVSGHDAHAAAILATALAGATAAALASVLAGRFSRAAMHPRLFACELEWPSPPDDALESVLTEAEASLTLAASIARGGRTALAERLASSAIQLARTALDIERHRERLRTLPGARSSAAQERCTRVLAEVSAGLATQRVNLAEAGAAEELGEARVDDALRSVSAVTAEARAAAEVAFIGMDLRRTT